MVTTLRSLWSGGAVTVLAALALTTACTTGEGRAPSQPVVDSGAPALGSAAFVTAELLAFLAEGAAR
jgi:hypothetical protein